VNQHGLTRRLAILLCNAFQDFGVFGKDKLCPPFDGHGTAQKTLNEAEQHRLQPHQDPIACHGAESLVKLAILRRKRLTACDLAFHRPEYIPRGLNLLL
jgi:hypothetical protein